MLFSYNGLISENDVRCFYVQMVTFSALLEANLCTVHFYNAKETLYFGRTAVFKSEITQLLSLNSLYRSKLT